MAIRPKKTDENSKIILQVLAGGPMSGRGLREILRARTKRWLTAPQFYQHMATMEDDGLVVACDEVNDDELQTRTRVYELPS